MELSHHALTPRSLLSNAGFVRNLARSLLQDPNAADDIAQQTLVTALERPPSSTFGLRGWLASVARSLARQTARGEERRRMREASASRAELVPAAAEITEREALRSAVVQAVLALPEPSRAAVLLRSYEDKTPREIATLLGVPVETVRTRIKRGLDRLRDDLDSRLGGEREGWMRGLLPLAAAKSGATLVMSVAWKAAAVAGIALVSAGAWRIIQGGARPSEPVALVTTAPQETDAEQPGPARAEVAASRESVAAEVERVLSGTVTDPRGKPVADAVIYVSPDAAPPAKFSYHPEWIAHLKEEGLRMEWTRTDAEGRFRAVFADLQRVYVAVVQTNDVYSYTDPEGGRWLDLPASDVELRVQDAPTAEVCVTARLAATGEAALDFECGFRRSSDGLVLGSIRSEAGRACQKLPFHPRLVPDEFDVWSEDEKLGRASTRVRLKEGEHQDIELSFPASTRIEGQVVDTGGAPVEGALVLSGVQIRLRGDEPFKPFQPERVQDGGRTDARGWYAIEGTERWVTVWHERFSPTTVKREAAALVRLEPRSTIRGRFLDSDGTPVVCAEIALDRERKALTDGSGAFVFEDVEAGIRGLRSPAEHLGLSVPPGETVEIDLGTEERIDVEVELLRGGAPCTEKFDGALVGTHSPIGILEFEVPDGRLRAEHVRPGTYVLLSSSGVLATVDLSRPRTSLELGTHALRVRATPGTRIYLVPAGTHELVELLAGRVASRTVPPDGVLEYAGLVPGRYGVGIDRRGVQAEIEITDGPAEVAIE